MYDVEAEEIGEAFRESSQSILNLVVNLGVMSSVMSQYPEHVQEGFVERLRSTKAWAEEQVEEVLSFGEFFD